MGNQGQVGVIKIRPYKQLNKINPENLSLSINQSWVLNLLIIILLLISANKPIVAQSLSKDSTAIIGGPENTTQGLKNDQHDYCIFEGSAQIRKLDDWKAKLHNNHGLSFGLSAIIMSQYANSVLNSTNSSFGGVYRLMASWMLVGRGTGHTGRLELRAENRSAMPGFLSGMQLGNEVGMAALNPGFGYTHNFSLDIPVVSWVQGFNNNRAGFAIGRLGFDAYLDPVAFQTFSRAFVNRSFVFTPATPTTGIGALGAVIKGFITEQIWLGGQIYDANATSGTFNTEIFKENEWLSALEVGFTPSFKRRKTDKIQFSYWFKDAREEAGISKGNGWLVSATYGFADRILSFVRFGGNNGGAGIAAKTSGSGGLEFKPKPFHAISIAGGWARPSEETSGPGIRDEYAFETSYVAQLLPKISLMADFQFTLNPTNNPAENSSVIVGLRTIINL